MAKNWESIRTMEGELVKVKVSDIIKKGYARVLRCEQCEEFTVGKGEDKGYCHRKNSPKYRWDFCCEVSNDVYKQ